PTFSWPITSGPFRSGRRYWVTSVPHTPATSTFISAASSAIGGRSSSRSSVVDGPTFTAARTFSDTRNSRGRPRRPTRPTRPRLYHGALDEADPTARADDLSGADVLDLAQFNSRRHNPGSVYEKRPEWSDHLHVSHATNV